MIKKSVKNELVELPASVATRKEQLAIDYLTLHPQAKIAEVAKATGVSTATVSNARRAMGRTRKSGEAGHVKSGPLVTEALKTAVKSAGGTEALQKILDAVDSAGGIQHVRTALRQYAELREVFGKNP